MKRLIPAAFAAFLAADTFAAGLSATRAEIVTAEFNKQTCYIGVPFTSLSNGEWKIELVDAQAGNFTDRRQWNSYSASLQLCPKGGLQWNGKVSDGTTYVWKWRIKR